MPEIINTEDALSCLNNLGAALARAHDAAHASQKQFDFMRKIANHLYDAHHLYDARHVYECERESKPSSEKAYRLDAVEYIRKAVALIESVEGRAYLTGLDVPSRVIAE
ncbi:MAG: hypothetical protein IKZ87_05020, partial [Actinomycetaceae bacterium]|nr:hypothetical protein [Actinomycetaceae bacterium]